MKRLNKWQSALFVAGAVLMVIGAATSLFRWEAAPWFFGAGALAYTTMQMQQTYEGRNFTVRRLRRIMLFSDFLLLLSAALMFISRWPQLGGLDWLTYVNYVHNNWVVTLLLAAILQLYTTYRIDKELGS
jgi:hypothetical protein